jgi:hypothetical protein
LNLREIQFQYSVKREWKVVSSRIHIDKHLSDAFPFHNRFKEEGALSPVLFNFALEYGFSKVQEYQEGLEICDLISLSL